MSFWWLSFEAERSLFGHVSQLFNFTSLFGKKKKTNYIVKKKKKVEEIGFLFSELLPVNK
jgi:hypothetical protein